MHPFLLVGFDPSMVTFLIQCKGKHYPTLHDTDAVISCLDIL